MKTAELKKTADHIERAESEEEFINRLRSALKEHAIEFVLQLSLLDIRPKSKERAEMAYNDLMD